MSDYESSSSPGAKSGQMNVFRAVLLALALIYTLYFARSLLVPMVVALLLALMLSPLVAVLKRLYIPRSISAVLLLCAFGGPFALLTMELAEPAQKWVKRLPELSTHVSDQVSDLTEAMQPEAPPAIVLPEPEMPKPRKFTFFGLFGRDEPEPQPPPVQVEEEKPAAAVVNEKIMQGSVDVVVSVLVATPVIVAQLMTCVILILFLLVFGPRLFNAAVDIFPRPENRTRIVEMFTAIRGQLSRYILTVSVINTLLGLLTAGILWWLGVEDALLWGVMAGLLNFAPYVGPIVGILILSLAGFAQYGLVLFALAPALVFFALNVLEAQFITPTVLGYNLLLNPLILMIWLFFWGWLWGVMGVLLAVPLLVCFKIAAEQLGVLASWTRLVETKP